MDVRGDVRDRGCTFHQGPAQPLMEHGQSLTGKTFSPEAQLIRGRAQISGINSGGGITADNDFTVLINGFDIQDEIMLSAFSPNFLNRRLCVEGIARKDLSGKPNPEFCEAAVTDIIGQHLTGHPHG